MLSEIYNLIRYGTLTKKSHISYFLFKITAFSFLLKIVAIFIFSVLAYILDLSLKPPVLEENNSDFYVLIVVVIAPLIEELAFRLPLKYSPKALIISTVCISFILSAYLSFSKVYSFDNINERLLIAFFLMCLCGVFYYICKPFINHNWEKVSFYLLTTIFAILHIIHFTYRGEKLLFITLGILIYFPFSILLSYARIKKGLSCSIFIHILNNLIASVIKYI